MGADRGVDVVHERNIRRAVKAIPCGQHVGFDEQMFDLLVTGLGEINLTRLLVYRVVTRQLFLLVLVITCGLPLETRNQHVHA